MIRVATYNVHAQAGRDGIVDFERIGQVLLELDADIVGLQELESAPAEENGRNTLAALADMLDATPVRGTTMMRGSSEYGNAILSRLPVQQVKRHRFPASRREPRGVVEISVDVDGQTLRFVTTHFGLWRFERKLQTASLIEILGFLSGPTVLVGDFNVLWSGSPVLRGLRRVFGRMPAPRSFPAHRPVFALDRIWVHPAHLLDRCQIHRSSLARMASDHLPVAADINLG